MHCPTTNATMFLTLAIAAAACGGATPSALTGDNAGTVVPVVTAKARDAGAHGPAAGSAASVVRVRSAAVDDAGQDAGIRDMGADAAMENPSTAIMVTVAGSGGHPQAAGNGGNGGSGGRAGASAGSAGDAPTAPGDDDDDDDEEDD